ncbi:hypothetical protein COCON_G00160940 [Conger conger]|uniref:Uncharacterized protein n=1 Tax=Conger conger TaxID=82655 RepID=A0A9Q1DA24_CONCO|nr:hypothetical protein COCON_G00160940 [Conger conger]
MFFCLRSPPQIDKTADLRSVNCTGRVAGTAWHGPDLRLALRAPDTSQKQFRSRFTGRATHLSLISVRTRLWFGVPLLQRSPFPAIVPSREILCAK